MTSAKAIAGGIAGNLVTIALWAVSLIPGWTDIPDEPRAAIIAIISTAIGAGAVYFAPANRFAFAPEPPKTSTLGLQE